MVKIHTNKDAIWTNAAGDQVPLKFVPKVDLVKEKQAATIYKLALNAEKALKELHAVMSGAANDISLLIREHYEIKNNKKKKETESITWFNWNRSIKIEAKANDIVKFDDGLMNEARELLNKYLNAALDENTKIIGKLVNDAFSNRKGGIVPGMINKIIKFRGDIKNASFQKACDLMIQAQSTDKTKIAHYVWERQENGEYRNINLNFGSL